MIRPTRRRLLTVMGAAAGITLAPTASTIGRSSTVPRWTWRGTALGAKAGMTLVHPDEATAKKLILLAVDEIERLENIFSLYRDHSEITRLNRDGYLDTPSPDLVTLLSTARQISELTDGAFDVTVQPLWRLYADHFSKPDATPDGPPATAIEETTRLVDYRSVELEASKIRFGRADMAITLNGIAQGYITDRVVDLLRAHGIEQTLIDLGEIRSVGAHPDGRPWRVAIESRTDHQTVDLIDRAIATSSPANTVFDPARNTHHLFEPKTGRPSARARTTSVIAGSASLADGLSTAFSMMSPHKIAPISNRLPGLRIIRAC